MTSKALATIGEYVHLMGQTFRRPNRWRMFYRSLIREIVQLGVDSLWIVFIISFFIGAVITIQLSINIRSPLIPKFTIGYSAREMIMCLGVDLFLDYLVGVLINLDVLNPCW